MKEFTEVYTFDGYTLSLESTNNLDKLGHEMVRYEFKNPSGEILFSGEDFGASPLHDATGLESAKGLLGFLTLKPGDTDAEYFDGYTEKQLEFCNSMDCENLQIYAMED